MSMSFFKVVDELDLKDGIVLELQQKIGTLHIELENVEKERREVRYHRSL